MLANCVLKFCVTYLCGDGRINCFETISIVNAVYRAIIWWFNLKRPRLWVKFHLALNFEPSHTMSNCFEYFLAFSKQLLPLLYSFLVNENLQKSTSSLLKRFAPVVFKQFIAQPGKASWAFCLLHATVTSGILRCQAKFLTYYCLSVILLLRVKEWSLAFAFLMCVV